MRIIQYSYENIKIWKSIPRITINKFAEKVVFGLNETLNN